MQKYDLIGDIHGYATTLKALLTKLDYHFEEGAYRHPERKVIFLGDFIDRGPEIRETLQTVRAMVDGGSALAVMGNHEFNALAYHAPDGQGDYLRKHTPAKIEQHRATMEQLGTPYPEHLDAPSRNHCGIAPQAPPAVPAGTAPGTGLVMAATVAGRLLGSSAAPATVVG